MHLPTKTLTLSQDAEPEPAPPAMMIKSSSSESSVVSSPNGPAHEEEAYSNTTRRADGYLLDGTITGKIGDIRKRYHISRNAIGRGSFGVVRRCTDRATGETFAVKSIKKSKVERPMDLVNEISTHRSAVHAGVVRLIDVVEDSKYVHVVTEIATGGDLFDAIVEKVSSPEKRYSERSAAHIIKNVLEAVDHLHEESRVCHRDIKPENIVFETSEPGSAVKLIDFGLATHITRADGIMCAKLGTPLYLAPEVLTGEYTKACDLWSVGVVTYMMMCGYHPFSGESDEDVLRAVLKGDFYFYRRDWAAISDDAKFFISCLLQKDTSLRWTASEALSHPWIVKHTREVNGYVAPECPQTTGPQGFVNALSSADAIPRQLRASNIWTTNACVSRAIQ